MTTKHEAVCFLQEAVRLFTHSKLTIQAIKKLFLDSGWSHHIFIISIQIDLFFEGFKVALGQPRTDS